MVPLYWIDFLRVLRIEKKIPIFMSYSILVWKMTVIFKNNIPLMTSTQNCYKMSKKDYILNT